MRPADARPARTERHRRPADLALDARSAGARRPRAPRAGRHDYDRARPMTTTRGLVALGDSTPNGHGEPALGVHPQSWAQWVAEVLGLPFTKLATDGAQAADVLREQVPRLDAPYDVGCVFAGVNDVRAPGFDAAVFARDM